MKHNTSVILTGLLLMTGCRSFVAAHYLPDAQGEYHAACRVWHSTLLMTGETVSACLVPTDKTGVDIAGKSTLTGEHQGTREALVPMAMAKGWAAEAKGGGTGTVSGNTGDHNSERKTTDAGMVQIPAAGASGIVVAQRDDDIGIETASVFRWGFMAWLGTHIADMFSGISSDQTTESIANKAAEEATKQAIVEEAAGADALLPVEVAPIVVE